MVQYAYNNTLFNRIMVVLRVLLVYSRECEQNKRGLEFIYAIQWTKYERVLVVTLKGLNKKNIKKKEHATGILLYAREGSWIFYNLIGTLPSHYIVI